MLQQAIYMTNGRGPDPAIRKGLVEAGCEVISTHSIVETLTQLKSAGIGTDAAASQSPAAPSIVLIAEVQAGAIPLLTLLHERGTELPPTLIFDRDGSDIRVAIKALQLGVKDYLLASDSEVNRELYACVLAQREGRNLHYPADIAARIAVFPTGLSKQAAKPPINFEWNPVTHVIHVGPDRLKLSPIEARIFNLLYAKRGQVVTMTDFISDALKKPALDPTMGARQLRPHLMRLRRKLGRYSNVANRIVNTRGEGYMLVQ
jgi:DNA-binding response OmpR family regulator